MVHPVGFLRHLRVNAIPFLGRLQEIRWHLLWQLSPLSPLADLFKIAASMLCVEIHERLRMLRVQPDLAKDTRIESAHELLADDVETVC